MNLTEALLTGSDGTPQGGNLSAEVASRLGKRLGQGADLGLGLVGPSQSAVKLALKIGEVPRGLGILGAPPGLTRRLLEWMPLEMCLDGGRRPRLPSIYGPEVS
jgi:hypothetical protein